MNLKTKKIIAREFLILTIVLSLTLLCFFCTYPYNYFRNSQIDTIRMTIAEKVKMADSLGYSYKLKNEKQNWFWEMFFSEFNPKDDPKYNTRQKVWNRLEDLVEKDSIKIKWEKEWSKDIIEFHKKIGFNTPEEFKTFIEVNGINSFDETNYNQALKIKQEVSIINTEVSEIEKKVISTSQQVEFGIKSLIALLFIFFGIRFLYYATRWSIIILNQKNE